MSSIVETAPQISTARTPMGELHRFWIFVIVFAAVVACASLASAYPDPVGLDVAAIVGP